MGLEPILPAYTAGFLPLEDTPMYLPSSPSPDVAFDHIWWRGLDSPDLATFTPEQAGPHHMVQGAGYSPTLRAPWPAS